MSTEKLSELSKPVGFAREEDIKLMQSGKLLSGLTIWRSGKEALYSQEYVSALLAELEATESRLHEVATVCATAEQRIAELEDAEQNLCAANVTLDARASEAESKLATPVRLLGEMLPHEWERAERQAAFEHRKIAWDARLAEDKKAILAAGFTFTVEGDE